MAALSDMFAAASLGTYPTPTPTNAQRAAYAVSYGLLSLVPSSSTAAGDVVGIWFWEYIE